MTPQLRDLIRRQIELEDEGRALGARRYAARSLPWKIEAGSPDEEANLPPGQHLLRAAVPPAAEAIRQFVDEAFSGAAGRHHSAVGVLEMMDADEAAYLTLRCVLNSSSSKSLAQTVAIQVADALVENAELTAFRGQNKLGYKGWLRAQQSRRSYSRRRREMVKKVFSAEGVGIKLTTAQKVATGLKAIELVMDATGLFVRDQVRLSRGYGITIRPSETLQHWLDNEHARCSLLSPVNMPMVVRPRRWRTPNYGGYLTPRPGNRLVKQRNKAYHEELRLVDIDPVYASVNHVQDTRWRINRRVLDVMMAVWDGGGSLGGLPMRDDEPLPPRPLDIDTNDTAKTEWKRAASDVYARNADRVSARMAVHQGLWVAKRFAEEEAVYFPHELDFRGRMYPIPAYGPNPQGSDWQKGVLEFADGLPLGEDGRRWLMIHIANLFGVDKVSFDDRIEWTLRHHKELLDSADNPLDGDRFWTTADSPYMALAACFEFAGMLEQGVDYVSRLPIALDGSCSGLQHFSAMLRDEEGARAVNLLPSEHPADVYSAVAQEAQRIADMPLEQLREEFPDIYHMRIVKKENGEEVLLPAETYRRAWAGGKIIRSIAKRPTMTFCYSATRFGMQKMIAQSLRELEQDGKPYLGDVEPYYAAVWLSHVLYRSVGRTVQAAAEAMEWLRTAAQVASKAELPLWWTTPLGLPILQEYKRQSGRVIDTHWAGRRITVTIQVDENRLDSRAQANSVAPNFVHSLDAAHLQAVALRCRAEGVNHLAVIHDSFGTHAANTGKLSRILRETFIEQYSGDVLRGFYEELKGQLGDELGGELPEPPRQGSLDLSQIIEAEYTFA